ncbi:MAG TPA: aspartyl/asparaginyl beta-hydroxylase domain-containing protein [Xanthobacteraceae bacterium]
MKKILTRVVQVLLVLALCFFLPKIMLVFVVCGAYDVSRNRPLTLKVLDRYFFGNGVFTWLLSPFNVLMDILALPYVNKGVYRLEDLPKPYQEEIQALIDGAHKQDLVGQLQRAAEAHARSMFFFKWYGANVDTVIDVPAFHRDYQFIKTVGVSVFSKKESTSKHFGPLRATFRVLYNVNDMEDDSAYIVVGGTTNYWRKSKLFIFDDTLLHQSFNESDKSRYCLFVDIARPSMLPALVAWVVTLNRILFRGLNSIFYKKWKVIEAQ